MCKSWLPTLTSTTFPTESTGIIQMQQFSNLQCNNHPIQMWDCLYINQDKQQVYLHHGGSGTPHQQKIWET